MKLKALAVLILSAWAVTAHASFPNNYTLYVSVTSPDGNVLNETFHITGNMLPPVPNMPGVLHTPSAIFALGTTRFNYGWAGVCPTCDMNDYAYPTANYQLSCGDVDYPCTGTEELLVSCQILGSSFVNTGPSSGYYGLIFQRAISIAENTQVPIGDFGWQVAARCSTAVSPPDFNPTELVNPTFQPPPPENFPYYKGRAVCSRAGNAPAGTAWICSPTFKYLNLTEDNAIEQFINYGDGISKYNCTNRDKGFTGKPWP